MALYHFNQKIIQRSNGNSAFSAFAYQSRSKVINEMDGTIDDYSNRDDLVFSLYQLPELADSSVFEDPLALIREMEISEANSNAQIGVYGDIALSNELSKETQIEMMKEFAKDFTDKGQAIMIHQHEGHSDNANDHFHFIATIREFSKDGKSLSTRNKSYKNYLVSNGVETIYLSASELKERNDNLKLNNEPTFDKIYKYRINKSVEQLTQSEAKVKGLHPTKDRTSRYPVSETIYFNNFLSKDLLIDRRNRWEEITNNALKLEGHNVRISAKSYKDLGIDLQPQNHLGSKRHNMVKSGLEVDVHIDNQRINLFNKIKVQSQLIFTKIDLSIQNKLIDRINRFIETRNDPIELDKAYDRANTVLDRIERLEERLGQIELIKSRFISKGIEIAPDKPRKASQLDKLNTLQEGIDNTMAQSHRELISSLANTEQAIYKLTKEIDGNYSNYSPLQQTEVNEARQDLIQQYNDTIQSIPIGQRQAILNEVKGMVDPILKEEQGFEAKKARTHLRQVRRESDPSRNIDRSITHSR